MASRKKKKETRGVEKKLELADIEVLGGSKADLDLVVSLDDDGEVVDVSDDLEDEPIKKDEIKNFIKQLGIHQQFQEEESDEKKSKKEKKKKLLVADQDQVTGTDQTESKPKKQRNKYKVQDDEVSSTTTPTSTTDLQSHIRNYKSRNYQLIKPGQEWFPEQDQQTKSSKELPVELEKQMESFASKLLEDEVEVYTKKRENSKKSETNWIKTVLSTGTLGDKIAALTLLVQESPVHNLVSLDSLIAMAKKKGKRECMMATDTLRELFTSYLLPDDRKLKMFTQNPLGDLEEIPSGNRDAVDKKLVHWSFESKLKECYASFIKALDMMSHDTLLATKQKALGAVFELLVSKPEAEKTLLSMLVNKIGDPDYKLASKATHYLTKLVDRHPNMKSVVVGEVERVLYRPNISDKAQYYCVCFLNQLLLSHEEKDLATKLISVYFSFFKSFVKKGEVDSKMMSALLSGVNRAYPYAKVDHEYISTQMNTLYKIVHIVNFNTSLQALMLLYQVMDSSQNISDRYYIALYKKMTDPTLKSSSKQAMFLNLLFKSIKKDIVERRVQAFIKRLLQICSYQPAQFVCGALVLLGEILKSKPNIIPTSCTVIQDSDDEEEHFKDIPDPDDEEDKQSSDSDEQEFENQQSSQNRVSSWVHKSNTKGGKTDSGTYDPHHRNPLYCHAELECIWELRKLANHFHPSVSLFANNIIQGEQVTYPGDPLQDFTTIRFLDRFVYKNPKKKDSTPALSGTLSKSKLKQSLPRGAKKLAVNSDKYLERGEESIPVDEKFLYRYFAQKAEKKKSLKGDLDNESETESVSDAEFDDFLDNYEKQFEEEGWEDMAGVDLDFAGAFGKKKGNKGKKRSKKDESDDDEDGDDDMDDLSDEEVDFEGDDDFAAEFKEFDDEMTGFDEENVDFSEEDELAELQPKTSAGKKGKAGAEKSKKTKKKKGDSDSTMGIFASAEEFAHLLDENAGSKFDMTGTAALANKDNAHVKQLKWETDRDRWLSGKTNRKRKNNTGGKKRGFNKKKKKH